MTGGMYQGDGGVFWVDVPVWREGLELCVMGEQCVWRREGGRVYG